MSCILEIEEVAFGGSGVARRSDGMVCFVPFSLPGEVVEASPVKEKSSYCLMRIEAVLSASPGRTGPRCPVFGLCGGCQYQHATYDTQLQLKQRQVGGLLQRIAGVAAERVSAVRPSPEPWSYRNRITVHTRGGRTGFYRYGSRQIVEITGCPIASEEVNSLLRKYLASRRRDGEHVIREQSDYRGFSQVNPAASTILLDVVKELVTPGSHLVDAYCGAGHFAGALADRFTRVTGIEWSEDAVRYARENAPQNAEFVCGDVGECLGSVLPDASTLLLNPPQEGCPAGILGMVCDSPVGEVVYVSCDPATLARDVKRLAPQFSVECVVPVDMFPQTARIECVCHLTRTGGRK